MVSHWVHELTSLYFSISEENWEKRKEKLYILLMCCLVAGRGKRICLMVGLGEVQALFSGFTTITMSSWPSHLFFALSIPRIKWGGIILWRSSRVNDCQVPCKLQKHHLVTKGKPLAGTAWSTSFHHCFQTASEARQIHVLPENCW